jgi:hypothetical protein
MTVWEEVDQQSLTLFYAPGVRSASGERLEAAKDEFSDWLDRRSQTEKLFVTSDQQLAFDDLGNNTFRVRLNEAS